MSSFMDLKYLGLNDDEIVALRKAVRSKHPKGGMQTASCCACGAGSGGPAASDACRAFKQLMEAGAAVRLVTTPRRDRSVCDHTYRGSPMIWEYNGKTICEMCSSEV